MTQKTQHETENTQGTTEGFISALVERSEGMTRKDYQKFQEPQGSIKEESIKPSWVGHKHFLRIVYDTEKGTTTAKIKPESITAVFMDTMSKQYPEVDMTAVLTAVQERSLIRAYNEMISQWVKANKHLFVPVEE